MHKYIDVPYIPEEMWDRHDKFLRRLEVAIGELHESGAIDLNKLAKFKLEESDVGDAKMILISAGNPDRKINWTFYVYYNIDEENIESDCMNLIYNDSYKVQILISTYGIDKNEQDFLIDKVREFFKMAYTESIL